MSSPPPVQYRTSFLPRISLSSLDIGLALIIEQEQDHHTGHNQQHTGVFFGGDFFFEEKIGDQQSEYKFDLAQGFNNGRVLISHGGEPTNGVKGAGGADKQCQR